MNHTPVTLSVVVPVRDEAAVLARSLRELNSALIGLGVDFEVIAVDDGSTDSTADVLKRAAATNARLQCLALRPGLGKGAALKAGFSAARGATIAFVDADSQIPGPDIGCFLAAALQETDVFFTGIRVGRKRTVPRRMLSTAYRLLSGVILSVWMRDVGCPLKAFPARLLASNPVTTAGWVVDAELLAVARWQGIPVRELPVAVNPDLHERSNLRRGDGLRCLRDLLLLRNRAR